MLVVASLGTANVAQAPASEGRSPNNLTVSVDDDWNTVRWTQGTDSEYTHQTIGRREDGATDRHRTLTSGSNNVAYFTSDDSCPSRPTPSRLLGLRMSFRTD